jgi:cytochrome c oxidase subunit 2
MTTNKKKSLKGMYITWFVLTVVGVLISLWAPGYLMPRSMSDTMHLSILTIVVFSVAAAPVAAGVYAATLFALQHWVHKGKNVPPAAEPIRENNKVVAYWLGASTILTVFLLIWGLGALAVDNNGGGNNPLVVNVTGQQWVWSFSYPGTNVQSPKLMLPEGRTVVFHITSEDITHGFWIADMGVQVDANAGVVTTLHVTPNALGDFNIRCTQFCGLNHAFMVTSGQVLPAAQFNQWLSSQSKTA